MKFDIPKITRSIDLGEYAAEYEGTVIWVWVNPPAKLLNEHDQVVEEVARLARELGPELETIAQKEPGGDARPTMMALINKRLDAQANELTRIFSELWSQGAADTRWTEEEIRALVKETEGTEPRLWPWLRNESIRAIRDYRAGVKKN